jgi:PAS domain S-box-containing protein
MWERGEMDLQFRRGENSDPSDFLFCLAEFFKLSLSQYSMAEILNLAANFLADALPLSRVAICSFTQDNKTLSVRTLSGLGGSHLFSDSHVSENYLQEKHVTEDYNAQEHSSLELPNSVISAIKEKDVLVWENKDGLQSSIVKKIFGTSPIGDTVVIPVPGKEFPWGIILVSLVTGKRFKIHHNSLFRILAYNLAVSIQRCEPETQKIITYKISIPDKTKKPLESFGENHKNQKPLLVEELLLNNSATKQQLERNMVDVEQSRHWLLDSSLVGIYITLDGNIVRCNDRFAKMFEYTKDELLGNNLDEILQARKNNESHYYMLKLQSKNSDEDVRIINTNTKNQNSIWIKCAVTTITSGCGNVSLGNVIDITEQVKVEDSLLQSEKELHTLSRQLINAQENERKRVASELHDGICQTLSTIKYKVEQSTNECGGVNCEVDNLKHFVVHKIQNAIEEVRRISMDLRPSILDDLGLMETIEWQLREFQSTHRDIEVNKCIDVQESDIPEILKISVFRILQEALNNISKHANAQTVSIQFCLQQDDILFTIEDDGKGINSGTMHCNSAQGVRIGLGLKNMQERAKLTGGILETIARHPSGTRIQVLWPARQD